MKKFLAFFVFFSSATSFAANTNPLEYSVNLIANFPSPFGAAFAYVVGQDGSPVMSGGFFSQEGTNVVLRPDSSCSDSPLCGLGNAYVSFSYFDKEKDKLLCKYEFNIFNQHGYFSTRNQYQPPWGGKPITCYAVHIPNQVFVFVREIK